MHILIAPDKFKGSLTAAEAASAIHRGFLVFFPKARYTSLPLSDGGEGMLEAIRSTTSPPPTIIPTEVADALGSTVTASWLMLPDLTAIIEASQANGIWRISPENRDLPSSNTHGVGELLLAAIAAGARKIIVGIGGSATNDGGIGLAAALGCQFLDPSGRPLDPIPANFPKISSIDSSRLASLPPITVACDVANPLLGPRGATRIYGPQKGLLPRHLESTEAALARFASLANATFHSNHTDSPGAGAAGGLGYGLLTFCNATFRPGFDCISEALRLQSHFESADLVITGEGSLDSQTLEGKVPHGIATLARSHRIPVFALAGSITDQDLLHQHFDGISSIVHAPMSLENAISNAPSLLEQAAARLARTLSRFYPENKNP